MEFKSTLQVENERIMEDVKEAKEGGMKEDTLVKKVFELVSGSEPYKVSQRTAGHIAKTIQPSITFDDYTVAVDMQLALCCHFVYLLIKDSLIIIKE